jgi:hypothetical protein
MKSESTNNNLKQAGTPSPSLLEGITVSNITLGLFHQYSERMELIENLEYIASICQDANTSVRLKSIIETYRPNSEQLTDILLVTDILNRYKNDEDDRLDK